MLQNHQYVDPSLALVLKLGSGLFWTITYLLIIRRGFIDKRYGMPMLALCANISWEFIFSFVLPHNPPQLYIDYVWLFFDVFIAWHYLRYGRRNFDPNISPRLFIPVFVFSLASAFAAVLCITYEFNDTHGVYAAFAQNLLMSALFIQMLWRRNNTDGQSVYIALCKLIGTAIPSVYFYLLFPGSPLLIYLFLLIFVLDVVYLVLLYRKQKEMGIRPWKKW
jgi:hypothetical protein